MLHSCICRRGHYWSVRQTPRLQPHHRWSRPRRSPELRRHSHRRSQTLIHRQVDSGLGLPGMRPGQCWLPLPHRLQQYLQHRPGHHIRRYLYEGMRRLPVHGSRIRQAMLLRKLHRLRPCPSGLAGRTMQHALQWQQHPNLRRWLPAQSVQGLHRLWLHQCCLPGNRRLDRQQRCTSWLIRCASCIIRTSFVRPRSQQ